MSLFKDHASDLVSYLHKLLDKLLKKKKKKDLTANTHPPSYISHDATKNLFQKSCSAHKIFVKNANSTHDRHPRLSLDTLIS